MFRQHFSAPWLSTDSRVVNLHIQSSASGTQSLRVSSGERVNQSMVKPGVNHSDASFFSSSSTPTALFAV